MGAVSTLPCDGVRASLSGPALLLVPAARPAVGLLGLSLELVRAPGSPFSQHFCACLVLDPPGPGTQYLSAQRS